VRSVRGIAGGMSAIADKFTTNMETSPANSKFLTSNLLFVNLKLITHCIQRLCCNRTSLSDMLVFRTVSDVCTHMLLEMGDTQTETVLAVMTECSAVLYKGTCFQLNELADLSSDTFFVKAFN